MKTKAPMVSRSLEQTTLEQFLPKARTRATRRLRTQSLNALKTFIGTANNHSHRVWTGKIQNELGPTFKVMPITTVGHLLRCDTSSMNGIINLGKGGIAYLQKHLGTKGLAIGQLVPKGCWD